MVKLGFYLLGQKGYIALSSFLGAFIANKGHVKFVCVARDAAITKDYYDEIIELCYVNNIPYFERTSLPENVQNMTDYSFAIGWRWIIFPSDNLIVLHDSLLPKYRGFSPLVNMLINGESKIGVTALFASDEYDKGDVIEQESLNIEYPIKIATVIDKISVLYGNLIIKICDLMFTNNPLPRTIQIESDATYSMWRDESDYAIDWSNSAVYIERFINSVSTPFAGAYSFIKNNKVRIIDVEIIPDVTIENRSEHVGKIIFKKNGKPVIVCGSGLLLINSALLDGYNLTAFNFRSRFTKNIRDTQ